MTTHTTLRSPGALALGLFFAAVTARTIFDDVWHGAEFSVAHINAAAALVAAIAAGHMIWPALKAGRIPAALGLALIFVASTGYIVTSAGARNAEAAQAKAALILKINEERATARRKVVEAEADVLEAKDTARAAADAAARECASGKKTRCDGKAATRDYAARDLEKAESHATLMRGILSLIGPEQKPFEGYAHAAKVFEAAGMGRADVIEARLTLLMPFALVLISELGTLVFLGLAIGHRQLTTPSAIPAIGMTPVSGIPTKTNTPTPPKGGRRGRKADQRVLDFSEAFSRKHGRAPSGSEIKSQFPELPTSTAYDYAARCRAVIIRSAA